MPKTHSATRRTLLAGGLSAAAIGGLGLLPSVQRTARAVEDFIKGPPMRDIKPIQLSQHVYIIPALAGFPTPDNQGMMSNVTFVVTSKGVVVLDSGSSVQIGEMVLRMIKTVTPQPVIAVFNSHYHGDHFLGNQAFQEANPQVPIYALAETRDRIQKVEGSSWRSAMERFTNQSTAGTKVVVPNQVVDHGQTFQFGDVTLKTHFYGRAHTPSDLSIEVVEDKLVHVGDIAMHRRIANIEEGSYTGTFEYYKKLREAVAPDALWVPGHGDSGKGLLDDYEQLLRGIYEPCLKAVEQGKDVGWAKAQVLADPRVKSRAAQTDGFDDNIGKYTSLAYLEAEQIAF